MWGEISGKELKANEHWSDDGGHFMGTAVPVRQFTED